MRKKIILVLGISLSISQFVAAEALVISKTQYFETGIINNEVYVMFTGGYQCMFLMDQNSNFYVITDVFLGNKSMQTFYTFSNSDSNYERRIEILSEPSDTGHTAFVPQDMKTVIREEISKSDSVIITIKKSDGDVLITPFNIQVFKEIVEYLEY